MARKLGMMGVPSGYMVLDNPDVTPPVDRKIPVGPRAKQFGFEVPPKNINDMSVGEASAGVSRFRRAQFYSSVGGPAGTNADEFVYNNAIGIATARSVDTRPRFWHVSFFAVSVISAAGTPPLTEAEILRVAGREPTNTTLKGRVQIFDESGSRFYDVNIHGTAGFSFYGFGVTTSILLPSFDGAAQGSEVNATNPGATPILLGAIENTLATGRIIPTFQNVTQITDQITRTVTVPSGAAGGSAFIPIPPGARAVRIRKSTVAAAPVSATYFIGFASAPSPGRPFSLGVINRLPGRDETQLMAVPNATFIAFTAGAADPEVSWVATFVVEV